MQHPFLKAFGLVIPGFLSHDAGTAGSIEKRLPGFLPHDTDTAGSIDKKKRNSSQIRKFGNQNGVFFGGIRI